MEIVKSLWMAMFTPPWRPAGDLGFFNNRFSQLLLWFLGWLWSILGLILGAFIATPILTHVGVVNMPYQDGFVFIIVTLCAFLVQIASFALWFVLCGLSYRVLCAFPQGRSLLKSYSEVTAVLGMIGIGVLIFAGESYALWRFIQTQNVQQGLMTSYVIGGFILKAILFPAIQAILVGAFLRWIRQRK